MGDCLLSYESGESLGQLFGPQNGEPPYRTQHRAEKAAKAAKKVATNVVKAEVEQVAPAVLAARAAELAAPHNRVAKEFAGAVDHITDSIATSIVGSHRHDPVVSAVPH